MKTRNALRKTILAGTCIKFMLIMCFLIPTRIFASDFTAKSLGDYGNVTVMEVTGNYDVPTLIGSWEQAIPRQIIAQEFFKTHKDEYDFLVIFTNFDFQMPEKEALAFYMPAKNDIQGIGMDIFDNTQYYGSNGKLHGTIDMANVSKLLTDPMDPGFEWTLGILAHEMMHRWAAYINFKDINGNISSALLGHDSAHWSFLLDSAGSVMYGNVWQDNGNGTFTTTTPRGQMKLYSPLDLYLMGMIDKSKVPPMLLIDSPNTDSTQLPQAGVTVTGTAQYVTIDQIIAAMGPRVPDASSSQKAFKAAFILITQPETFTGNELYGIENIRNAEVTRLSILTDGQAIMEVASTPKENIPANPGIIIAPTTPRTLPPNINDGVQWLMTNQKPDGSWADLGQTIERDTAEATLTLKNFTTTQANYQSGILWLGGMSSGNMDFLSRKIQALPGSGQDLTSLVNDVLSRQNGDGGWGSDRSYASNPMDTALALKALSAVGYTSQQAISQAIAYLKTSQNTDGGWGNQDKGSTVQETSNVLSAFNQYRTAYQLDETIAHGTALLVSKQNSDGGFGNSPSTVYDTATAAMTMSELNASGSVISQAVGYILSQQSDNGSWGQSAYQTALAVETVYKATVDPDLSIKPEDISFIPANVTSLPANVVINANIWNLGATSVPQAKVVLYDGNPATGTKIGEQTLAFPSQQATTVTFSAIINDGNEHVFTIVVDQDNLVKESNKLNNSAVKALYPQTTYDFEVLPSNLTVSANIVNMLQDVTITAQITNKGTMNAYNVQVKYYIDDPISPFDIATQTVDIPAGARITNTVTWRANKSGMNLPLTVLVDPFNNFTELSKTNNKASTPITVNGATASNLSVSYQDIVMTPSPANQGGNAVIAIAVKNNGFSPATNVKVNFYEGVPGESGVLIGSQILPAVNTGDNIQASINWANIPDFGQKIIYARVDPDNQITEIRKDDNDAFTTVNILSLPDLAITSSSITFSPDTPKAGDAIYINALVQNQGQQSVTNVQVNAYEGSILLGSQVIPYVAGNSQINAVIVCNSTMIQGLHQITVMVDPDNAVGEPRKDNNSASRTLAVQNANLWVTEPYISPNGDGVKDSTQFSFRLQAPQTVGVTIVNQDKAVVKTFSGPEFVNTAAGMVSWDGLGDSGMVVDDGQYQMQVVDGSGVVLGSLLVIVDNNRSPLSAAAGTKYMVDNILTCQLPPMASSTWLPDENGILFTIDNMHPDYPAYPQGFYTMTSDGNDIIALLPPSFMDELDPQYSYSFSYALSPTGEKVAINLSKSNKSRQGDFIDQTQLWIVDIDGSNLKQVASYDRSIHSYYDYGYIYCSQPYYTIQTLVWSPDGSHLAYTAPHYPYLCSRDQSYAISDFTELWLVNSEGKEQSKIGTGSQINPVLWSPNSQKILYSNNTDLLIAPLSSAVTKIDTLDSNTVLINYWWSPDSGSLVYTLRTNAGSSYEWKLRFNNLSGDKRDLYTVLGGDVYGQYLSLAGWTPGQEKIWVLEGGCRYYTWRRLRLMDINNGSNVLLYDTATSGNWWHSVPLQSPDGHFLVFSSEGYAQSQPSNLFLADDQGNLSTLRSATYSDQAYINMDLLIWSAESDKIAFIESRSGWYIRFEPKLYVIDRVSKQLNSFSIPKGLNFKVKMLQWLSDSVTLLIDGSNWAYINNLRQDWYELFLVDTQAAQIESLLPSNNLGSSGLANSSVTVSPSEHYIYYRNSVSQCPFGTLSSISFLHNLVADLRVTKKSSFFDLRGIAQDLNFDGWTIEYADAKNPGIWTVIASSDLPVVSAQFASWAPPYEGTFFIRLTVRDKAGNIASRRRRVQWGQSSASITSLHTSRSIFSPNGGGTADTVELNYRILDPVHLEFNIYDDANNLVRSLYKDYAVPTSDYIAWNGKDESGNVVPDGKYTIKVFDYEFVVTVDNTPPQVSLTLSNIRKDDKTFVLFADLLGHAVDSNLKTWIIEYGVGDNPHEWYEYMKGESQIAKMDGYGNPVNPIQDEIIKTFLEKDIDFLVGKKLRITAEDFAGNRSSTVADFLEVRVILDRFYVSGISAMYIIPESSLGSTFTGLASYGQHFVGGLVSVRAPLVSMNVQYRIGTEWVDGSPVINQPTGGIVKVEWSNPGENVNAVRIKAADMQGNIYYSNILYTANLFYLDMCTRGGRNYLFEELRSLKLQIQSGQDSRYPQWTNLKVYTAPDVPVGSVPFPLEGLQNGSYYSLRMIGESLSGKIYTAGPNDYPPAAGICKDDKNPASLALSLDINYQAAACNSLSTTAKVAATLTKADNASLKTLSYYIQKPEGLQLLRQIDLSRESWNGVTVDTVDMPEGSYSVQATLSYLNLKDNTTQEETVSGTLIVDRVLPTARITYPAASAMFCPIRIADPAGEWYGVHVEGKAIDNNHVQRYELSYGIGESPAAWTYAMTKVSGNSLPISVNRAVDGQLGVWDVTDLQGAAYSLQLKVVDVAGNTSCATTGVSLDTLTEIKALTTDKKLFSSNGAGVNVNYEIDEKSTVDVKVFKLLRAQTSYVLEPTPVRTIAAGLQHQGGGADITWNGKKDDLTAVDDGLYAVMVFATDSCGNTAQKWIDVEIDNTPPTVTITYPQSNDPLRNIVEVKGTADDIHFERFKLEYGMGDNPTIWKQVASGAVSVKDNILETWNTFGLEGTVTLRLTATDIVGNTSEAQTTIDLASRKNFVKTLDAAPKIFSPNDDEKLESTIVTYEITDTCNVKLEIIDANGTVKKTYSADAIPAGVQSQTWDGKDDTFVMVADGVYTVRLTAALLGMTSIDQVETVSISVDTVHPAVDITQPVANSYVRNDITMTGSIADKSLATYSVVLSGSTGTIDHGNQPRENYAFGIVHDLPDGAYTLTITATDQGQNITQTNVPFTVDNTAPVLTLDIPKNGGYFGRENAVVSISGSIVEKDFDSFILRYGEGDNPAEWKEFVSGNAIPAYPQLYVWKVGPNDGVHDGLYTLSLFVTDKAGFTSDTRVKLTVDNTAPTAYLTSLHDGDYVTQTVDVKGTALDLNLDNYTVDISEGQCDTAFKWELIKKATTPVQDGILATWQALPAGGDYCLRLRALDKAGLTAEAKVNVKVDTQPPAPPVLSGTVLNKSNANLVWTNSSGSEVAGYNVYRNSQMVNTALINSGGYLDQNLTEGLYAYTVKTVDLAGLESQPSNEVDIKIDLTGPDARILTPQDGVRVSNLIDIKGTANSTEDFKQYRVSIGQGATPSVWTLIRTSPVPNQYGVLAQWDTLGLVEDQPYTIKLEAEDLSGNITTNQVTIIIDNTPPAVPVLLSATASVSNVTITWRANSDSDFAGYLLYRNDQLANASGIVIGNLKPYLLQGTTYVDKVLPDGMTTYYLIAMDQAGNMSDQSNTLSVVIDTHPPHAAIVDPTDKTIFEHKIMVKAESPDLDVATVQFQYQSSLTTTWTNLGSPVTNVPFITYLDPTTLGIAYGDYHIRAVATDNGQKADPGPGYITVTFTDLTPPAASQGLSAITNGSNVSLVWTSNTETDLAGYNVYRTAGGYRTKINASLISSLSQLAYQDAGASDGAYAYDVTAIDAHGNESMPSNVVSARVYAPVLDQPYTPVGQSVLEVNGSAEANSSMEITVQAVSGSESKYSISSNPSGSFTFPINLMEGENTITARATDIAGNVSRPSNMVIVVYNTPPAAPTGLTASTQNYNVHLTWNANSETDISGYNLYRDGVQINAPVTLTTGTASASSTSDSYNNPASKAFDGNLTSYWASGSIYNSAPIWWQVEFDSPRLITGIEIDWRTETYAGKDYEIQAWTGYAWVSLIKFEGKTLKNNVLYLKPAYRTSKMRIYILDTNYPSSSSDYAAISEVRILEDNLITNTSFDDVNLSNGKYDYKVTAVDYYGIESNFSDAVYADVGDVIPPAVPQDLKGQAAVSDVTLIWSVNSEPDLSGYNIFKNTGQGWQKLNTSLVTENHYEDRSLKNGTYNYRVTALDMTGNESQPSETQVIINVLPPNAPVGLVVGAVPEGMALTLSWLAVDSASGYSIYRSTTAGGPYTLVNSSPLSNYGYIDAGLTNGTSYFYVVTGLDSRGNESLRSNEAVGVPSDAVPPSKPVILFPIKSGTSLTAYANEIDIGGLAEIGSTVELFHNGVSEGVNLVGKKDVIENITIGALASPMVSPDGKSVAYVYNQALWLKDIASGQSEQIINQVTASFWSADGKKIVYQYFNSDSNNRIGIYDLSTKTNIPVTNDTNAYEYNASFSSQGDKIAYISNKSGFPSIWLKDMVIGSAVQVTNGISVTNPKLSPDGRKIAYFGNSNGWKLYIYDVLAGTTTLLDSSQYDLTYYLDWSPDSMKIVFVTIRTGNKEVFVFDSSESKLIQLTNSPDIESNPHWSPDGRSIVYLRNWASLWISSYPPGENRKVQSGYINYLSWLGSGDIACIYGNMLYLVHPDAGYFEFKNVPLNPGENTFYVTATDVSGNKSGLSDGISVVYDTSKTPDLTVTTDGIYLYPHYPVAGEQMAINIVVWNNGLVEAKDVDVDIYVWNANGQMELLKSDRIPSVPGQSAALVSVAWDSTGMTGQNRLVVAVDPYDSIVESDESNNMSIKDFIVSDRAGVTMTASMDNSRYRGNQNLVAEIALWNNGDRKDVTLNAQIEDENGYLVSSFNPINASLSYGQEQHYPFTWNTGSSYAGSYQLCSILTDTTGVLSEKTTTFTIVPDTNLGLGIVTDKSAYGPNENVVTSFTVKNAGTNYIVPSLRSTVTITNAEGAVLFSEVKTTSNLLPGSSIDLSSSWNAGLTAPGSYTATVTVSSDGVPTSTKSISFTINAVLVLTGNITVSPSVVSAGNAAQLTYVVADSGNADAVGITARISTLDPETQIIMTTQDVILDIAKNASTSGQITLGTSGYGLKTYTAILQALSQGKTDTLATAFFSVKDLTPPVVTIITPVAGGIYNKTIIVSALATDNSSGVESVEYQVDNGTWKLLPVADPTQGRYSTTWDPMPTESGAHTIYLRATDKAGNTSTPVPVTFVIQTDTTPPGLILSTLPDGAYTNNPTLNIAGTATDNIAVQTVTVNETQVLLNADGTFSQAITLMTGTNTVSTIAADQAGNTTTDTRTITLDQTAPAITITSPADNSATNLIDTSVTGTVDKYATVSIKVNGNSTVPDVMTDSTFTFPVTLAYGQNSIVVTATDLATNSSTPAKRTVTYDNVKPSLAVTNPGQDMSTTQNQITLTGEVSDLIAVTVTVAVDGNVFEPAIVNGKFEQVVIFTDPKTYQIDVTAVDEAGNQSLVQRNVIYNAIPQNFGVFGATGVSISGGYVDSYDSTQGAYNDTRGSNVSVGTNSAANRAIDLSGGSAVYGDVYAGPGGDPAKAITKSGGAIIYGAEGALSMLKGMTPVSDPGGGTSVSFKNGTTLTSGTYRVSSINLSGSGIGTINGSVTIYVTGSLNLSGGAQIVILPGGSLTVYLNGKLNVSGGSIVNETLSPHNLTIYGTATCTSANYSGNSAFYGVIYAPAAKMTISGGNDIYGSVIGSSVNISGGAAVHYDNSLGNVGP